MDKKYTVIEINDTFVICHGSRLSWDEAHTLVLSNMLEDCENRKVHLNDVRLFELEANDPGLGVTFKIGDRSDETTYYILDDPGDLKE